MRRQRTPLRREAAVLVHADATKESYMITVDKKYVAAFQKKAAEERRLFTVMFELNWRCNLDCVFCYLPQEQRAIGKNQNPEMSTDQVFKILDQLEAEGVYEVAFTGGEIFLRKDIFPIIAYAEKKGFDITLLTSASLINETEVERLKSFRIRRIEISFHAMSKKIFEQITQRPGSFHKVKRAVELLVAAKIPIKLKSLLTTLNKEEIVKVNEWARSLGVLHTIDDDIELRNDGDAWPRTLAVSEEEAEEIKKIVRRETYLPFDRHGNPRGDRDPEEIERRKHRRFHCGIGRCHAWIDPSGKLKPCQKVMEWNYDLLQGSLKTGWWKLKEMLDNLPTGQVQTPIKCEALDRIICRTGKEMSYEC